MDTLTGIMQTELRQLNWVNKNQFVTTTMQFFQVICTNASTHYTAYKCQFYALSNSKQNQTTMFAGYAQDSVLDYCYHCTI